MELAATAGPAGTPVLSGGERAFVAANEAVVIAMGAVMVALVFGNVVCRYVFHFSLVWAEEVSQYLMVWVTFLAAGLALRQGRHVAVEMLQERLPDGARRGVRWGIVAAVVVFLAATAVLGCMFAWFAKDMETPVLNISMGIPYAAVPIGCVLTAVHLLLIARASVAGQYEHPESFEPPVDEGEL